jgi:hypothetical protein
MHDEDPLDAAWEDVRGRHELSGEAKLAWLFVWRRALRRPGEVWFTLVELLADQGRRDVRSPREWIKQLKAKRFIEELESGDGRYRVYVKRPQDVLRPVERRGFTDELQRRLPLDRRVDSAGAEACGPGDDAGDGAQYPPGDAAPPYFPSRAQAHRPSPCPLPSFVERKGAARGAGDAAQEPPREREPRPIGEAFVASLEARASASFDESAVSRLAGLIGQQVPGLYPEVAALVARAVLERRLPEHELRDVISYARSCAAKGSVAWHAFMGAMRCAFARHAGTVGTWPYGKRGVRSASDR